VHDKQNDILAIHKGFARDEKFKGNIDIGQLILDVSTKGRIRGVEIINATEFFKEFNIGRRVLESISDAQIEATVKPNQITLGIVIEAKNKKMPAKIAVPLEVPISC
jgi:uncharacterized protein YuzE